MALHSVNFTEPDVYGQRHPIETPQLIAAKLRELEQELEALPEETTVYVRQAQEKCPHLLTDEFNLLFLRCEVFNAPMAAKRYATYWKKRVEIFGPQRAFEPLRLSGNVADVQDVIAMGVLNVIEANPAGCDRTMFFSYAKNLDRKVYTHTTFIKAFWYLAHVALENEETAKKGLICIGFPDNIPYSKMDNALFKKVYESFASALPMRISAYHLCHPPTFWSFVWPLIKLMINERLTRRMVVHYGSEAKVVERLQTKYGMCLDDIPTILGGSHEVNMRGWMSYRKKYEDSLESMEDDMIEEKIEVVASRGSPTSAMEF